MDRAYWEGLLGQLERELEVCNEAEKASALRCRIALIWWDVLHDVAAAERWLTGAGAGALDMRRQLLLALGRAAEAAELLENVAAHAPPSRLATAQRAEAALLHLLWLGDAEGAARVCRATPAPGEADATLSDMTELSLCALPDSGPLLQRVTSPSLSFPTLIHAAAVVWDSTHEFGAASELLHRAQAIDENDPLVLELLLELACWSPRAPERTTLLEKKLALLSLHDPSGPEAQSTALQLARLLIDLGHDAPAAALLKDLREPPIPEQDTEPTVRRDSTIWARPFLQMTCRDLATRAGDERALAEAYRELAGASHVPAMARVYRLRAAQIRARNEAAGAEVSSLLQRNFEENPADLHTARALEIHRVRTRELSALAAQYEAQAVACPEQKGILLRKAALLAEAHLKDPALAASLRKEGLSHLADPFGAGDLQRLYRLMGSQARLAEAYSREVDTCSDPSRAALLWNAVAVHRLGLEQWVEAEAAASEALRLAPHDVLARALLLTVAEVAGRTEGRLTGLRDQIADLCSPINQAEALRQLAALTPEPSGRVEVLQRALELRPDDRQVLSELASAHEAAGQIPEAVRLVLELAESLEAEPERAAEAYLRLGRLRLRRLGDAPSAIEALSQALALAPGSVEAIRELSEAQRQQGDLSQLALSFERLARLEVDATARASLMLELAGILLQLDRGAEAVIQAAVRAIHLDHARTDSLVFLERVAREAGRLDLLAAALRDVPPQVPVLSLRAKVLGELDQLAELVQVLVLSVELTSGPERADCWYRLGLALERQGDVVSATARYHKALEDLPAHLPALRALQRIYAADHRSSPLAEALEAELELGTAIDGARRTELLLQLGSCLEELGQVDEAAQRFEEALARDPANRGALGSLERLYDPGRPLELARVLKQAARAEPRPAERARLCYRAGAILAAQQDPEQADAAMREAFELDPGNRDIFTSYERYLYDQGWYHRVMELYDRAIRYVEKEQGRAYRLVDLYSRRGQLQHERLGQPGEAAASYLKALECDPGSDPVMGMLETIFVQQEDWLGLIQAYEHRAHLAGESESLQLESLSQAARLAAAHLSSSPALVVGLWEEIYRIDPANGEAWESLERLYGSAGEQRKLVLLLEGRVPLVSRDAERIALHLRVAELWERLEDPEAAARTYEEVRALEPHHEAALEALARIYEALGRWEMCSGALRDLVIMEADPDERSVLYFKCGSIAEARFGDDEQAIEDYEAAIQESPGCLPAMHSLRDLYLRRKDWNRALETLESEFEIWEEARERAGILARMAEIRLAHLQDERKAIEHFEEALQLDPDCHPAALALFNLYFARGESARALARSAPLLARMSREGDPESRSTFYSRRGQMLAAVGQVEAAAESLVTALQLRPKNLEALDWLIALCRRRPDSYDFADVFRQLEQVYRRENDQAAVGHVLVAAGALSEIAGDAEVALLRYGEAMEVAPDDLSPVKSLADLLVRLGRPEEAVQHLRSFADRARDPDLKARTLARLGDTLSNVHADPARALRVFEELLTLDPEDYAAADRVAQELFVSGRYEDAYRTQRALVEQASASGLCRPPEISAYAHYLGVILLARGEVAAATEQFRRALQLDEANARAAMALARQLVASGDRAGAEQVLLRALQAIRAQNRGLAVDLQRSLAGLYSGGGMAEEALLSYEAIAAESGLVEDRVALAEFQAAHPGGLAQAVAELERALEQDGLNVHALQLMARLLEQSGEVDRAVRVLGVLDLVGGASEAERRKLGRLRRPLSVSVAAPLDAGSRRLLGGPLPPHLEELWRVIRDRLERLFAHDTEASASGAEEPKGPELVMLLDFCRRLIGTNVPVRIGRDIPGGVMASNDGGGNVLVDRVLLERAPVELAFVFGRTLEYVRSGHALISRLAFDDRLMLGELLDGLLRPAPESNDLVHEFRKDLGRKAARQVEDICALYQAQQAGGAGQPADKRAERWLAAVDQQANSHGLLACDDIEAALRMLAHLTGQELALGPEGQVELRLLPDGAELVRVFLSADYLALRRKVVGA